jgi:ABC-type transport system substrate-binding protein
LWANREFDSALNSIASTTGDARRAAFINLAKETQKNPQAIYLLDYHQVYAMRDGITWTPTPGIRNFDFTTIRPE